jgi:hypothetical protein
MKIAFFKDRAQEYGRRLNAAAPALTAKYDSKKSSESLIDAPKNSDEAAGSSGDLAETDAVLITEISSRAQVNIKTNQT